MGSELYGIIANVNGVGYPIAYLLYTALDTAPPFTKTTTLVEFFQTLSNRGFDPLFFFSDKDQAQMSAIETVWGPDRLRLCLWHMLRAVSMKLAKQKPVHLPAYDALEAHGMFPFVDVGFTPSTGGRTGVICPRGDWDTIGEMMKIHYHMHPMIPDGNVMHGTTFNSGMLYDIILK